MPFLVYARDYLNVDYHRLTCFSLKLHFPSLHCDSPPFTGAKAKKDRAQMWTKSKNCFRKINKIEKDIGGFDASYFAEEAVDLYIMAHEALVNDDRTRLHELVTSKCFTELRHGLQYKTLRWGYTRRLACALPCFIGKKIEKRFSIF